MIPHQEVAVPLHLIDPPETPSRETIDPERVGALADDIAGQGLLQRPGVSGPDAEGRYRLAFGHRRLLACRLLGWRELPCKVWPHGTDTFQMQVSENNVREALTPIEEAKDLRRARDRGQPIAALARLWRRSGQWVEERLALLELPDDLQAAVQAKAVSIGVARVLGHVDSDDYRRQLIAEATRTGATLRTVETWIAHYNADRERIVSNLFTVQEIAQRREAWVLKIPCELCGEQVEYPETQSIRACHPCMRELARIITERAAEARAELEAGDGATGP